MPAVFMRVSGITELIFFVSGNIQLPDQFFVGKLTQPHQFLLIALQGIILAFKIKVITGVAFRIDFQDFVGFVFKITVDKELAVIKLVMEIPFIM